MIKILEGFPGNVVAAVAAGRLTRHDYDKIRIPRVETVAHSHSRIRCYYEIGADFAGIDAGAVWEDFRIGVEYWVRWERVAVVTDMAWIAHAVIALRLFMLGQMCVYSLSDQQMARAWISEP